MVMCKFLPGPEVGASSYSLNALLMHEFMTVQMRRRDVERAAWIPRTEHQNTVSRYQKLTVNLNNFFRLCFHDLGPQTC
jgi:hypothetical protein